MKIKRAMVVWKIKGKIVTILSKKGVFQLNLPASKIWLSLNGQEQRDIGHIDFIDSLHDAGLIEILND